MKNIRKGVDMLEKATAKVECGNFGNCCYNTSGRCCQK